MDFVTRLKQFLELNQIPVTQFADNCRIPRPTLSQLLNGRNKKVSDEVIGKIHDAYPSLSIMWLMFGEGQMESSSQKTSDNITTLNRGYNRNDNEANKSYRFDDMFTAEESELTNDQPQTANETLTQTTIQFPEATEINNSTADNKAESIESDSEQAGDAPIFTKIPTKPNSKKRIVNIIVYYDDNSFEAFVPEK